MKKGKKKRKISKIASESSGVEYWSYNNVPDECNIFLSCRPVWLIQEFGPSTDGLNRTQVLFWDKKDAFKYYRQRMFTRHCIGEEK